MEKKIIDNVEFDVKDENINDVNARKYNFVEIRDENGKCLSGKVQDDTSEEAEATDECEERKIDNKKEYISPYRRMAEIYCRPYNRIGYNNDACQGRCRDDDMQR